MPSSVDSLEVEDVRAALGERDIDALGLSPPDLPLSTELGTIQTFKARLWPWLCHKSPSNLEGLCLKGVTEVETLEKSKPSRF